MLLAMLLESRTSALLFGSLGIGFPTLLAAFGARRNGSLGPLGLPLLGLFFLQQACFWAMVYFSGRVLEGPWVGGLPISGAIQIYLLWLLPLVIVSLSYALTFDSFSLKSEDIERIRQLKQTPSSHLAAEKHECPR